MKLPWDRNYLKISFHVVVTALAILIVGLFVSNLNLVAGALGVFFKGFFHVFTPFFMAIAIAYILDPLVECCQKFYSKCLPERSARAKNRFCGTGLAYIIIVVLVFIGVRLIVTKIGSSNINDVSETLNNSIQGFGDLLVLLQVRLAEMGILASVDSYLQEVITGATEMVKTGISNIAMSFAKVGEWIVNFVMGMTIAFYFLMEKKKIVYYLKDVLRTFLPERTGERTLSLLSDINGIFSNYIGGQVTDAAIMATLISVSFSVAGIPYPVIIGVISGFSNLIPYVGAIVAFILSVTMGLLSGTPMKALYAAIIVILLQQLDTVYIVPKVVGRSVKLHPVLVLLSIYVFGSIWGLWGMVFAVPVTAVIKLLLTRLYVSKKESSAV